MVKSDRLSKSIQCLSWKIRLLPWDLDFWKLCFHMLICACLCIIIYIVTWSILAPSQEVHVGEEHSIISLPQCSKLCRSLKAFAFYLASSSNEKKSINSLKRLWLCWPRIPDVLSKFWRHFQSFSLPNEVAGTRAHPSSHQHPIVALSLAQSSSLFRERKNLLWVPPSALWKCIILGAK